MIRKLQTGDMEQVLGLCRRLHARSQYADVPPDWPVVTNTLIKLGAGNPDGRVFIAEHGGKITGFLAAQIAEWWWSRQRFASDLLFYSTKVRDGVQLVEAMVKWAWSRPRVMRVEVGVSSGIKPDRAQKLYEALGFTYSGPMLVLTKPAQSAGEVAA